MQSILRRNDSDNLFHWDYCLFYDETYFDFIYSYRFVEVMIFSKSIDYCKELKEKDFEDYLNELLNENNKAIRKEKEKIEYWNIFQNTYLRLKNTINYFYTEYCKNYPSEPSYNSIAYRSKDAKKIQKQISKYINKINIVKNYGIGLRMLSPVLGESFINLVIYLMAKEEIKNDKRVFESITRTNIDIRIKTMHLNCVGFVKPFDQNDDRLKNFFKLMNNRNDFLHGNIMPGFNTFDHVHFDGTVPIFENPRNLTNEFTTQTMFQISKDEIEKDYKTINELSDFVLENIKPEIRKEIIVLLKSYQLGWNKKEKRIGILFPDHIVESFFIKSDTK